LVITAVHTALSVTEGNERSRRKLRSAFLSRFRLVEWIVPPIIIPLFLLLVIAVVALHG
jgi:hypothetical protein